MEPIELWKKNYENFMKNAKDMQGPFGGNGLGDKAAQVTHSAGASAYEAALLNWQKSSVELFKRFVQNQVELCHFFGNRWEHYLKLPDQLSQCRSLTEFGNLQTSFLSQISSDYIHETEKLGGPVAEVMTSLAGAKSA
jgi:hypothetical protein